MQYVESQDELIGDVGDENPNFQWVPPQGQSEENFLQDGQCFSGYRLQLETLVQLLLGHPAAMSGLATVNVHGHKARFVTDAALYDQAKVGFFCIDSQHVMGQP
jgi:hypothetical protein